MSLRIDYEKYGFKIEDVVKEKEGTAYCAYQFKLNEKICFYRNAKITPTKIGQFVTIWKRNAVGITTPFDVTDNFDFIIIAVKTPQKLGQFIFPKAILAEKGIISVNGKGGKRGFRVYPPWDVAVNKQAIKTQEWQLKYFTEILEEKLINQNLLYGLLNLKQPVS